MENIKMIMHSILESPILDLNTKSFVLVQELKNIYDKIEKNENEDSTELHNQFVKLYKQFKEESSKVQKSVNILQGLHAKIDSLERVNQDLMNKMSSIDIDYIYLEGSDVKPHNGNILVYNPAQTYFYVVFGNAPLNYKLCRTSTDHDSNLCGWYFDKKGWRSLHLIRQEERVYISPRVNPDNKSLNGGSKFTVLSTQLFKCIVMKNMQTINIFSDESCNKLSLFQFGDKNKIFVYDDSNIRSRHNIEKLNYYLQNVLLWDIDSHFLTNLTQGSKLTQLSEPELLQPLSLTSLFINSDYDSTDILLWNELVHKMLENKELETFCDIPLQTLKKSSKLYVLEYLFKYINKRAPAVKSMLNDEITEEYEYRELCNRVKSKYDSNTETIKKIISSFPQRKNVRKLDFFFQFLKYKLSGSDPFLHLVKDDLLRKQIIKCMDNIDTRDVSYPQFNKLIDNKSIIMWKNVIMSNTSVINNRKFNGYFEYLIFHKDSYIQDKETKKIIDRIVVLCFTNEDEKRIKIFQQILLLIQKTGIRLESDIMNDIISVLYEDRLDVDILKMILKRFTTNTSIQTCIDKINLLELFSYGIHSILQSNGVLHPLEIEIKNNICQHNNLKLNLSQILNIAETKSDRCQIYANGHVSGFFTVIHDTIHFTNNNNLFIMKERNLNTAPDHYDYIYCINTRQIFLSQKIYDKLITLENSPYDMLSNISRFNKSYYKINVDYFATKPRIEIVGNLFTADGNEFLYKTEDFDHVLTIQNQYLI